MCFLDYQAPEEVFEFFGNTMSEGAFLRARLHNAIRWIVCMVIGIPVVIFMFFNAGLLVAGGRGGHLAARSLRGDVEVAPRDESASHDGLSKYREHRRLQQIRKKMTEDGTPPGVK